jgi:hypothetical protein
VIKLIKLYHYSNTDFKGKVDPEFFGENSYSNNSARVSGIKRSYFYTRLGDREGFFRGCRFCYAVEVEESRLYNLIKDDLKICKDLGIKDIFYYLKKKGYIGVIGFNGFRVAELFKAVKITNKIDLDNDREV